MPLLRAKVKNFDSKGRLLDEDCSAKAIATRRRQLQELQISRSIVIICCSFLALSCKLCFLHFHTKATSLRRKAAGFTGSLM